MTEEEWLACEAPELMLELLQGKVSDRKLRLLGCWVQYSWLQDLSDARSRVALGVSERFADGLATEAELDDATHDATEAFRAAVSLYGPEDKRVRGAELALWAAFPGRAHNKAAVVWTGDEATAIAYIRDIFGNPFRPITLEPSCVTSTVASLARKMYGTRDFSAMPILADALMDAGCSNETILEHCRGPGPHVRGCFAVDLCLGKK